MNLRPYLGISGVMTPGEAATLVLVFENLCTNAFDSMMPTHDLMLGVLVSEKTLRGEQNKWPRRYPKVSDIQEIFDAAWAAARTDRPVTHDAPPTDKPLNLIHYASDVPPTLETIQELFELGCATLGGFQFNGTWPSAETLKEFASSLSNQAFRRQRIVLQVGPAMLLKYTAREITDSLTPYVIGAVVTDILIDASGGRGQLIDMAKATSMIAAIRAWRGSAWSSEDGGSPCTLRIGFAGGLSAETLTEGAGRFLRSGFSSDAEGRLRDDADGGGNLDLSKAIELLRREIEMCKPPGL
jgi:hypothetical protein